MIALADCNNFYASCERIFNPKIRNKPVVVLSNNDGCIISRSNEAKALGIKMGYPAFKYSQMFNRHKVNVFSTNFALYGDLSDRVMSVLSQSVSHIEIYSIDEAFMDYAGFNDPFKNACEIRRKIYKWIGIPISIGIAETKTLAKVANVLAKKNTQSGVAYLNCPYEIQYQLKNIPVANIWGIGNQYANKLIRYGVRTAYDLTLQSDRWIEKQFSITGLKIAKELRGVPCFELSTICKPKKSICTSRTFSKEIKSFNQLVQAVSSYATICSSKLRQQGSCAKTITVFILTNRFKSKDTNYSGVRTVRFNSPKNDSMEIIASSISALKSIYRNDYSYKKAGVILSGIISESQIQLNCFDDINDIKKRNRIMHAIDIINDTYGRMNIRFAINGLDKKWVPNQSHLSPCYTTQISDIIQVYTQ